MSVKGVLVDSDVFIGAFNERDSNHQRASALLKGALDGKYGVVHTSDFILDEIISRLISDVEKERLRKREIIKQVEESIQDSGMVKFNHIDESILGSAKICFKRYYDKFLSLTDWSSVILMRNLGVD